MNCAEFQDVLPEIIDGGRTAEQEAHLRSCRQCASLAADLRAIAEGACGLQASDEPSPRVWNSIEIALREEGLIHPPHPELSLVPRVHGHWGLAWLAPVAAAVVITFGVIGYERGALLHKETTESAAVQSRTLVSSPRPSMPSRYSPEDDEMMLAMVATRTPSMRAAYEANLQNVNAYIRDAEASVQTNPNDDEARQYLMDAYEQKAMVYEMALERSLP